MVLPDVEPETLQLFIAFLYHDSYSVDERYSLDDECLAHARLYVFAGRMCMDDLEAMAKDMLTASLSSGGQQSLFGAPDRLLSVTRMVELIRLVYGGTPDISIVLPNGATESDLNVLRNVPEYQARRMKPARKMLVQYALSRLNAFQPDPGFRDLLKDQGDCAEFVEDLISLQLHSETLFVDCVHSYESPRHPYAFSGHSNPSYCGTLDC